MKNFQRRVCVAIFDDVEVLDFCGPFEVFSVTGGRDGWKPFDVYTVAAEAGPVITRGGLSVNPRFTFADCPKPDILIIPGGFGTRPLMRDALFIEWIKDRAEECELVLSVCSGALLLAQAGLLDGLTATTHYAALDELRNVSSSISIDSSRRFIDNGHVIISGGISAGIDMSLYVVARLLGSEQAMETARYMEYQWQAELVQTATTVKLTKGFAPRQSYD